MCIAAPNSRRYFLPNLFGVTSSLTQECNNQQQTGHTSYCEVAAFPPVQHDTFASHSGLSQNGNSGQSCSVSVASAPSPSGVVTPPNPDATSPCLISHFNAPKRRRRRAPQPPGKTATDKERLFVKHNYHDLSYEPDVSNDELKDAGDDKEAQKQIHAPLSPDSFPMKLHRILDQIETDGLGKIVSWLPHGRAFVIRNSPLFVKIVMPRYFPKVKKLTSLQRQFNLYGFERLTREGPDEGAYYHECFLRGRPGLSAQRMVRKRVKGTGYKAASNPADEPDFYTMPFMDEVAKECPHLFGSTGEESFDLALSLARSTSAISAPSFSPLIQPENIQYVMNQFGTNDEDPGTVTESTQGASTSSGVHSRFTHNQRESWSSESTSSDDSRLSHVQRNNQWQGTLLPPATMQNMTYIQGVNAPPFACSSPDPEVQHPFLDEAGGVLSFPSGEDSIPYNVPSDPIAPVPLSRTIDQQPPEENSILMEFLDLWEAADAAALSRQHNALMGGN